MIQPEITFNHVTFKYFAQKYPTLKDISFSVQKGEKILIVGHSGSGKSTLGNLLNGLIPFSYGGLLEGSINLRGQDLKRSSIAERSRKIGTVLQDTDAQFLGLTVGEDVAFSLENDCVPLDEMKARVNDAIEKVHLRDSMKHSPYELSGGQKQRTALAGILVDDVDTLLFDEPLANLDPETGKYAIELIDEIHQTTQKTIIIIEHRIEDVLHRHVDRILIMDDGNLVGDDTPDALLKSSVFVECGLREPLYVALLRESGHALDTLKSLDNVHQIEGLDIPFLKNWVESVTLPDSIAHSNKAIEMRNVSHQYGHTPVLKDVSFTINEGEMIALVGENGAGKSTLAKVICGFETHQAGDIYIDSVKINEMPIVDRAKKVGFVMQNPNHMITKQTVKEEVLFGLELAGIDKDKLREKLDSILEVCGLLRQKEWPISALSYGQKKRVTIAAILILEPQIIILDEPTAGQDYKHYTEIMNFIQHLNTNYGYTIILITHDMHLMLEYTHRSIVLKGGQIIKDAESSDILTDLKTVKEASLKETSIFYMAEKIGVSPKDLVDRFIYAEKHRGLNE